MEFFTRLRHPHSQPYAKEALDAVYTLLEADNALVDRKEYDRVEVTPTAVVVTSWGFDDDEAKRKQYHAISKLVNCGLITDDHGFSRDAHELGGVEGVVAVPISENGGMLNIIRKLDDMHPAAAARVPQHVEAADCR